MMIVMVDTDNNVVLREPTVGYHPYPYARIIDILEGYIVKNQRVERRDIESEFEGELYLRIPNKFLAVLLLIHLDNLSPICYNMGVTRETGGARKDLTTHIRIRIKMDMDTERNDLHRIKLLSEKRTAAAIKKALLTPKGHYFISEAHTPKYKDAMRSLHSARDGLKKLLGPRLKQDRSNGLTWKAIIEKYEISKSTLADVRFLLGM